MTVHSVVVTSISGRNLFFKSFADYPEEVFAQFEVQLSRETRSYVKLRESTRRSVTVGSKTVVFQLLGSLIVYLAGEGEYDELYLSEIMDSVIKGLGDLLEHKTTEANFTDVENFGKFAVLLDEMMPQGIVEELDPDVLAKASKLKNW